MTATIPDRYIWQADQVKIVPAAGGEAAGLERLYSPTQPRGKGGKWTPGGGGGGGVPVPEGGGGGVARTVAVPTVRTDQADAVGWRDFSSEAKSKAQLDAWNDWMTDEGHMAIQDYLETGTAHDWTTGPDLYGNITTGSAASVERSAGIIKGMMRPSKADAVGWRGIALSQELKPGDRFRGRGFVAVAPTHNTATEFAYGRAGDRTIFPGMAQTTPGAHPYVLRTILPKGTPGVKNKGFESVVEDGTYRVLQVAAPTGPGRSGGKPLQEVTVVRE